MASAPTWTDVLAGQEATLKLLDRAFEKFSIKAIDPAGQRFDPESARGRADAAVGRRGAEHGAAGGAAWATSSTGGCCGRHGRAMPVAKAGADWLIRGKQLKSKAMVPI